MKIAKYTVDELADARRFIAMIRPATIMAMALLGFIFVITIMYHGMVTQGPQNYGTLPGFFTIMLLLLFVLVGVIVFEIICLMPLVKRNIAKRTAKEAK